MDFKYNEQVVSVSKELYEILSKKYKKVEDLLKLATGYRMTEIDKNHLEVLQRTLKNYQNLINLSQDNKKLQESFENEGEMDEDGFRREIEGQIDQFRSHMQFINKWKYHLKMWLLMEKNNVKPKYSMFY